MSERASSMTEISANTSLINAYATSFSYIDPWYFLFIQKEYVGKKVKIFCELEIPDRNQPTKGVIIGKDQARVNVLFKNMPEDLFFFIMDNRPSSHHGGVVFEKNGEVYLYITDVLGNAL